MQPRPWTFIAALFLFCGTSRGAEQVILISPMALSCSSVCASPSASTSTST